MKRKIWKAGLALFLSFGIVLGGIAPGGVAEKTGIVKEAFAAGTANDVVAVAAAEIGYYEKAGNASLDNKTANRGSGNYTKYARDLGRANGQSWCGTFVAWCFMKAGVSTSVYPWNNAKSSGVYTSYFENNGTFRGRGYTPKRGDIIFFHWTTGGWHTGIVESVGNGTVNTIEGNTSDQVARRSYSLTNANIYGFGVVNYPATDTTKPVVSNIKITNVTADGYTVSCTVTDNVGVTKVYFPTWTTYKGQDDIIWYEVPRSGNTATLRISRAKHGNYAGHYNTHIYAYDAAGNAGFGGIAVNTMGSVCDAGTGFYAAIRQITAKTVLTNDNVNVSGRSLKGSANQIWYFERQSDKSYKITSQSDGKCLDMYGAQDVNNTNVQAHPDNGSNAQRWKLYANAGGYVFQANCANGTVMDLDGGSGAEGTNLRVWLCSASKAAQTFELVKYYKVTFKNGNDVVKTQFVTNGSSAAAPVLQQDGYTLSWDKSYSNVNGNITVNAVWSKTVSQPSIDTNADDTDSIRDDFDNGNQENDWYGNDVYEEPSDEDDDWYDNGWHEEDFQDSGNENYAIYYHLNGGINNEDNMDYYMPGDEIYLEAPQRKGYTFKGWYRDAAFTQPVSEITSTETGEKHFYAKWKKVKPAKAKIKKIKIKNNKLQIVFSTSQNGKKAKGYQIRYGVNKKMKKKIDVNRNSISISLSKLNLSKKYYFKVRSYQYDSVGKKVYGKYSKTKKVRFVLR